MYTHIRGCYVQVTSRGTILTDIDIPMETLLNYTTIIANVGSMY